MTLYDDLGVGKNADSTTIKRAYKRRASATHPDKGGSTTAFQLVQRAYDILSDEARRKRYDKTGAEDEAPDPLFVARNQVIQIFFQLLDQNSEELNIISRARAVILEGKAKVKQQLAEIKTKIKKLDSTKKRLKAKAPNSFLHTAIDAQKRMLGQNLIAAQEQFELGDRMLELLKDFEYDGQEIPQQGAWIVIGHQR